MRPSTKRKLGLMGYKSYKDYCNSDVWKQRKSAYFKTHKRKCSVPWCRKTKYIHLHHVCYDRLGEELDRDLLPLCSGHHRALHNFMRRKRVKLEKAWPKYLADLERRRALRS